MHDSKASKNSYKGGKKSVKLYTKEKKMKSKILHKIRVLVHCNA